MFVKYFDFHSWPMNVLVCAHKFACVYVCVCVSGCLWTCVFVGVVFASLFPLSSHAENRGALRAEVTNRRSLDQSGSHNSYKF